MIKIGKHEIPTKAKDMTLGQFSKVSEIMESQNKPVNKILKVVEVFSKDAPDEMTVKQVMDYAKKLDRSATRKTVAKEITVNGRVYRFNSDPKAATLAAIEKHIIESQQAPLAITSAIYEDVQLSNTEHRDSAHIKHKMKLFAEVNADLVLPAIVATSEKLIENVNALNESISMEGVAIP